MASSSQGIAALAHITHSLIILPLHASHPTNLLPIRSDTPPHRHTSSL